MMSLMSFCCLYCYLWVYFTPFSRVSIANMEHVFIRWKDAAKNVMKMYQFCVKKCELDIKFAHSEN